MENIDIQEISGIELAEAQEKASYDIQITTAKRFPRDVMRSTNNSVAIATMDKETAESCGYALPRAGKNISGPSVHLARILAQNWGNIRVEARVSEISNSQLVSQAVCFDLENNYAVKVEVRRKITDKNGRRYNEDMITVTGNAANAIAYRNAVFAVIPKSVTEKVYKATKDMITGEISDETALIKRRNEAIKFYKNEYAATEEEILNVLGLKSINAIKQDHIVALLGFVQSIKDGDTTVDQLFGRNTKPKKEEVEDKKQSMKTKKSDSNKKPNLP